VDDADVTFAFGAASGTFQTITSAPSSTTTFTTVSANVLELAFEFPGGNGGATDLDDATNGDELIAGLAQTLAVSADTDAGYILAYQDSRAYLYRVEEGADVGADVAAADIALVGRFDAVAVGAFDASNFIDAA
jgi:hypothetical protein